MKHFDEDTIFQYLESELDESEHLLVSEHLDSCGSCKEIMERCRLLKTLLADAPQPEYSDSFLNSVMNTVVPPEVSPRFSFAEIFRSWAFPAFELGCALLLLNNYYSTNETPSTSVDTEMVLLAGLDGEISQNDFSPLVFDISSVIGISSEGL